jgi:carboxymethylenebutenolidase
MSEREIDIRTADGTCDAFLYLPDGKGNGPWPGVIYMPDIGGIRAANQESAKRLAGEGYAVLLVNVFYRTSHTPLTPPFRSLEGDARNRRMGELAGPLTPAAIERDANAYIDALAAQDGVAQGAMGGVGYCFTGKLAMYIAAARPEKIAAAASFHGGGLWTAAPDSPHLVLPRIKAQLYFGHATNDRSMPQEAIDNLETALKAWGGKYESEVYEGAFHSWTTLDSPVYNAPQAERAYKKLVDLLKATLG